MLNPVMFLFLACSISAVVSVMSGTSWTTIATIGVAFMGIGTVMGYDEAWIAGAVISGAYFGDKMSPLSDTTNLASGVTRERIEQLRGRLNSDERNYYMDLDTMADELVLAQELLDLRNLEGVFRRVAGTIGEHHAVGTSCKDILRRGGCGQHGDGTAPFLQFPDDIPFRAVVQQGHAVLLRPLSRVHLHFTARGSLHRCR